MLSILLWVHLSLCSARWHLESTRTENLQLSLQLFDQRVSSYEFVPQWTEVSHNSSLKSPEMIGKIPATPLKVIQSANPNADTLNVTSDEAWVDQLVNRRTNEHAGVRNETEEFLQQLQYYLDVLRDDGDDTINNYNDVNLGGDNSVKVGMSVIVQFLLEFYRIFRKLSSTQSTRTQLNAIDVYAISYDKAVHVMKAKTNYIPLEICAPLRRCTEIFKSILHKFVQMIQMECKEWTFNWQLCLVELISDSMSCPNVWYNFVHILMLRAKTGIHETFAYKIADLINFKELANYHNMFDFVIEKLVEYREVGRVQLSAEAVILTMLADLQENGLLHCVSVRNDYSR